MPDGARIKYPVEVRNCHPAISWELSMAQTAYLEQGDNGHWHSFAKLGDDLATGVGETIEEAKADLLRCVEYLIELHHDDGWPAPKALSDAIEFKMHIASDLKRSDLP